MALDSLNERLNLSSPDEVRDLMSSSRNEKEWNANCDEVKKANGNDYPGFWYATIILSGFARKIQNTWSRTEIK